MVDWSGSPKPDSGSVTDMSEMTTKSIGDEAGVIERASFDPKVCTYWLLSGTLVLTVTIIGIPFAVLWFLPCRKNIPLMPNAAPIAVRTPAAMLSRRGIMGSGWRDGSWNSD